MIRKLLIMARVALAVASYPLWTLAAAWLASPRGVLFVVGAALAFVVDLIGEGGLRRS